MVFFFVFRIGDFLRTQVFSIKIGIKGFSIFEFFFFF